MPRILAFVLVLATIVFVTAPLFTPPFTGYDPGAFPVAIPDPAVQPAPYAFSIWGVIYLWLLLHAGFGLARRVHDPGFSRVRPPLIVATVLGAVWLAIAGASPELAAGVIWLPEVARWRRLLELPEGAGAGAAVQAAMAAIEADNPQLAGTLPRS
ncbi:MAG TPA: hypothetical protein PLM52_19725, partial [Tabrizicola sp.]|nr:hypothetical protein [Tabrizicola sp.]